MKKCPNNHDNPDNAKFCRICGYSFDNSLGSQVKNCWNTVRSKMPLIINELRMLFNTRSSTFTPRLFPSINLSPSSVAGVDFKCKKRVVTMLVALFLFFILWYFRQRIDYHLFYHYRLPHTLHPYIFHIVYSLTGILFVVNFLPFVKLIIQWTRYKLNADYIESFSFMQGIYRIAKDGKLGLFEKDKKRVLLTSQYSNITKFDTDHILIEKNGKKGLYSINKRRIIVPVHFDRIEPFRNSIAMCHNRTNITYYDVNGNKMK